MSVPGADHVEQSLVFGGVFLGVEVAENLSEGHQLLEAVHGARPRSLLDHRLPELEDVCRIRSWHLRSTL